MKKIIALTISVLLFGAGCLRPSSIQRIPTIEPPSAANRASSVAFLRLNGGAASVTRAKEEKNAIDGAELAAGDRVKVTNGAVSLIYPEAGETRLENGTVVTIVSDDGAKGLLAELRLASGKAWTRFERLLGTEEQFSVAANGVVATVRGTAFGVAVIGKDVDVQVAENAVEVAPEVTDGRGANVATTVSAGEGMKIHASAFVKRTLSNVERASDGFRFVSRRLTPERLRRPRELRRLFQTKPFVSPEIEQRGIFLRQMMLQRPEKSNFAVPAREVQPSGAAPTNSAPNVQGPTPSIRPQDER